MKHILQEVVLTDAGFMIVHAKNYEEYYIIIESGETSRQMKIRCNNDVYHKAVIELLYSSEEYIRVCITFDDTLVTEIKIKKGET